MNCYKLIRTKNNNSRRLIDQYVVIYLPTADIPDGYIFFRNNSNIYDEYVIPTELEYFKNLLGI
jgi:hypothetical protein